MALFATQWTVLGLWATLAPRAFYDDFPGLGRHWIDVDGPYNEHLIRDIGELWLGVAAVALVALVSGGPLVTRLVGLVVVTFSAPHLVYHLATPEPAGTTDRLLSLGGLAAAVVAGALVAVAPVGGQGASPTSR